MKRKSLYGFKSLGHWNNIKFWSEDIVSWLYYIYQIGRGEGKNKEKKENKGKLFYFSGLFEKSNDVEILRDIRDKWRNYITLKS